MNNEQKFPHMHQLYSWDCGVSCGAMVTCYLQGNNDLEKMHEKIKLILGTESVWTVELAYALAQLIGMRNVIFFTKLLGINDFHRTSSFYVKELPEDEKRVHDIIENANAQGMRIREESITTEQLVNWVSSGIKAIILLDRRRVHCSECESTMIQMLYKLHPSFCGHFIVLIGVDVERKCFIAADPSSMKDQCFLNIQDLHKARIADGTDEDIILISVYPERLDHM